MGRYKASVGGWFRMWSRLWLKDDKVSNLSDEDQGRLVRVMCVANECLSDGRFEYMDIQFTKEQIAQKARVGVDFIEKMVFIGILQDTPFSFVNWEKYQNPDSKRDSIPDSKQDSKKKIRGAEDVRRKTEDGIHKTEKTETTDFQAFKLWWVENWEGRFKEKYPFAHGKDAAAIKRLLSSQSISSLKLYANAGWDSKEEWTRKQCATISGFAGMLPKLIMACSKTRVTGDNPYKSQEVKVS